MKVAVVFLLALLAGCTLQPPDGDVRSAGVAKFSDAEEFRDYLLSTVISGAVLRKSPAEMLVNAEVPAYAAGYGGGKPAYVRRHSSTNVQVPGIDEPDILKNDGRRLYYSSTLTRVLSAYPPGNMSLIATLPERGELLVVKDVLLIFTSSTITAYRAAEAEKLWSMRLRGRIVGARLAGERVYVVVEKSLTPYTPCSMLLGTLNGRRIEVECTSLYRPDEQVPVNAAYLLAEVDPGTGEVLRSTGFLGESGSSVLYMSENAVYVTFPVRRLYDFPALEDALPPELAEQLRELRGYRLSRDAKLAEYRRITESYLAELDDQERAEVAELMRVSAPGYPFIPQPRERTGIVKLSLKSFRAEASTVLEGRLLNQFSLDEHRGYLRVALSTGNDNLVRVLDSRLEQVGVVDSLGKKGERIFGVRFAGDFGYVVTFRQTDPFYVIDLSDPENPAMAGELEMPGYSSYLHPLSDGLVLGVGMQDRRVKLSLFDVSTPEEPVELDRVLLPEPVTEAVRNHRAFLADPERKVFFIPGAGAAYLYSYSGGTLTPILELPGRWRRAAYIGEYMYILSDERVVAVDERTWETAGELLLSRKEGTWWK